MFAACGEKKRLFIVLMIFRHCYTQFKVYQNFIRWVEILVRKILYIFELNYLILMYTPTRYKAEQEEDGSEKNCSGLNYKWKFCFVLFGYSKYFDESIWRNCIVERDLQKENWVPTLNLKHFNAFGHLFMREFSLQLISARMIDEYFW